MPASSPIDRIIRVTVPLALLVVIVLNVVVLRPTILTKSEYEGFFCRAFSVLVVVSILANFNRSRGILLNTAITLSVLWLLTCAFGAFLVQWNRAFNGPWALSPSQVVPKWILFGLTIVWLCAAAKHSLLRRRLDPDPDPSTSAHGFPVVRREAQVADNPADTE